MPRGWIDGLLTHRGKVAAQKRFVVETTIGNAAACRCRPASSPPTQNKGCMMATGGRDCVFAARAISGVSMRRPHDLGVGTRVSELPASSAPAFGDQVRREMHQSLAMWLVVDDDPSMLAASG
jgi:hypothetical protein